MTLARGAFLALTVSDRNAFTCSDSSMIGQHNRPALVGIGHHPLMFCCLPHSASGCMWDSLTMLAGPVGHMTLPNH